jgi:hypothetical protein
MMKKQTLEHNAAAIKRWRSRLKRAMSMLDKLEKQRKRLEAKADLAVAPPLAKKVARQASVPAYPTVNSETTLGALSPPAEIDTSIPSFLQRKKPDPVVAEIRAEQEATKKAKARGRIAKMKAKQRGDLKKMPLTGKAALAAIRA